MKITADNGLNLSTQVSQAFDHLGQLNQQVLMAITASHGEVTGGQEILNANNPKLNEIQLKLEGARKEVQRKKHQWVEARQFGTIRMLSDCQSFGWFFISLILSVGTTLGMP
jgi:hypothetical protein